MCDFCCHFSMSFLLNEDDKSDIKTEEIATLRGEASPKNKAISRPEENPAPIAVPTYNAAVLNAFFTIKAYFYERKFMITTE